MIVWIHNNLHFYMEKKLVSWFDLIAAKKVECLFDTYLQATNVWSHSTYQKRCQHKCLLLQLRKHNIAKNYSKENQELQIKSSRIVNMIKHFISSPETSFYILWIFQMPLTPFKRERAWKTEEKIRSQLWLTQARGLIQKTVHRQSRHPLRYQEKQELVWCV